MKTDVDLQHDVMQELDWEPSVDAARIGVAAGKGVVTLTGHVSTHTEKHTAEKAAKRVHGVKAVANDIEVLPSAIHQRDDEHVAAAAVHALEWDSRAPHERLQVIVRHGWITLEGRAEHRYEKEAAERAVRHLIGTRGVTNNIVLEVAETEGLEGKAARDIKADIERALQRSALVDASRISVEVEDDTVTLTGDVHSRAEHDAVERIAWTAREVAQIEDCITVTPWGQGPQEEWGY